MEGFCGGKSHQWSEEIGGRCGICGDPWDASVRDHEAPGGVYANGVIVREYTSGQIIPIVSHITANHVGFVEVRLCPNNNVDLDPEEDCFLNDDAALTFVETGDTKFWITDEMGTGEMTGHVTLPMWECDQCILQWTYRNGRDWGTDNGQTGAVETFRGCSDISIKAGNTTSGPVTTTDANNEATEKTTTVVSEVTTAEVTTTVSSTTTRETTTKETTTMNIGDTCHATGAWTGNPSVDEWCQENCHFDPPYCPPDVCSCDNVGVQVHGHQVQQCIATGVWTGDQAMDNWCHINCQAGHCPASHCTCS